MRINPLKIRIAILNLLKKVRESKDKDRVFTDVQLKRTDDLWSVQPILTEPKRHDWREVLCISLGVIALVGLYWAGLI